MKKTFIRFLAFGFFVFAGSQFFQIKDFADVMIEKIEDSGINLSENENNINQEFLSLYKEFIGEAEKNGVYLDFNRRLTIEFTDNLTKSSIGSEIGHCYNIGPFGNTITIYSKTWKAVSPFVKKMLLYHELGHCVLNQNHWEDKRSIMNEIIDNPLSYGESAMDSMTKELFKNSK